MKKYYTQPDVDNIFLAAADILLASETNIADDDGWLMGSDESGAPDAHFGS